MPVYFTHLLLGIFLGERSHSSLVADSWDWGSGSSERHSTCSAIVAIVALLKCSAGKLQW